MSFCVDMVLKGFPFVGVLHKGLIWAYSKRFYLLGMFMYDSYAFRRSSWFLKMFYIHS